MNSHIAPKVDIVPGHGYRLDTMPSRKQALRKFYRQDILLGQSCAIVSLEHHVSISWCLVFISVSLSPYFLAISILLPAAFLVFCICVFYHTNIKSPFLICQRLCYLANHPPTHALSSFSYSLHRGCMLTSPLSLRLSSSVINPKETTYFLDMP